MAWAEPSDACATIRACRRPTSARVELPAPSAIPPAVASRCNSDRERRRRDAGADCRAPSPCQPRESCWCSRSGSASTLAVGCRSPDAAAWALAQRTRSGARWRPLAVEGWRLRHSLPWRGRGDIDSLAIVPTALVFVTIVFCPGFRHRECPSVCDLLRPKTRSLPGFRPPGLLHSRSGVQSSAGGVAGRSGVLDGARRGV